MTNSTYNFNNWGISGEHSATLMATASLRSLTSVAPQAGRNLCLIEEGTNDFAQFGPTAQQVWQQLQDIGQQDRAAGCIPIIATMISRTGNDPNSVMLETDKDNLNALIRANWAAAGFAALADMAAFPGLGADGAYANPSVTCFYSDHVHLLGPSGTGNCFGTKQGYAVLGYNWANVINGLDGSTEDDPTLTTSTAYTEAFKDIWVLDSPTISATLTLPDCTGMTGQKRWVVNGSGSNAITVSGSGSSATIVGYATIAANTTGKFVCQLVSASAGGNQWVRTQ